MSAKTAHKWDFRLRFKARTFGWRSDLPIKRIKEAVSEVRQASALCHLLYSTIYKKLHP